MWLHLRPPEQCGFKSHQVPTFSCVGIRKYTFFRSNIDHLRFCYGQIRVMWLHLRPPAECGFKPHQVPTFSGVGIRKYTFFRPNIDHMRFCHGLIRVMWLHHRAPEQCGFKSHQVRTFSGVGIIYKNIHLFPVKYRTYTFLLWADTRNVVAPSPTRTVWVQIPPGANFVRCKYKKIHIFPAKYSHMPFATLLISSIFILSSV